MKSFFHKKVPRCLRGSSLLLVDSKFLKPISNDVSISPIALKKNFCLGEKTYSIFSFKANDSITKEAIRRFQVNSEKAIKHIDYIYYYYSRFVDCLLLKIIFNNNVILIVTFETNIFYCHYLDICSYCFRLFNFYHNY